MPNLKPPVTTVEQAMAYAARIRGAVPAGTDFTPLMTLYLTDRLDPAEITRASATRDGSAGAPVVAAKLYPAGATTNSDAGVTHMRHIYPVLEAMQREGLLLLVHGEVTSPDIDLFDREAVFIDEQLIPLRRDFPELRIVMEHITTREAAQYVRDGGPYTAATITAHHLLFNRNAIFTGGIRPHYYCLPVLKRETHRLALVEAATSGNPHFFLGTDSAPHPAHLKEHASGCAGCYTAHAALEMYAQAFDAADALDRLEGFASFFGADFYGLPRNTETMHLAAHGLANAEPLPVRRRRTQTPARRRNAGVETDAGVNGPMQANKTPWADIEWQHPWLAPYRNPGQQIAQDCVQGMPLCLALNQRTSAPVQFVPQSDLPDGTAYEAFIARTGHCPTREGLHDFFNGLCWIRFPATKRRLNQLQSAHIAADGVLPVRGPVRDALTVFDENAAFLNAPDALWEALQAKHWQDLFGRLRPLWAQSQLVLFGHALLEKLTQPRKPMTAHVYRVDAAARSVGEIDAWVAQDLRSERLATKPFAHLPVLGVPGWWPANADAGFYSDATVFRPPRHSRAACQ